MANQYVHVGSITNAMRGKKILEKNGIRSYVHRASHPAEGDGCGYSLLVVNADARISRLLADAGVRVIRVSDAI